MRLSMLVVLMAFTLVLGVLSSAAPVQALGSTDRVSADQHQVLSYAQDKGIDLEINVNKGSGGGGGKWYANPVWVAIGGLAVILLLALLVMAFKGGTTVVK